VIAIAGPNGAGKSTVATELLTGPLKVRHYVNADVIARGLSEFAADEMAIAAGKIMLTRLHALAAARSNFAFETTLASRTFAPWLRGLIEQGYAFHLIYMWLPTAEMAVERVARRVKAGGHSIPVETIERRYYRSIGNFFELYQPIARTWRVYNNVGDRGPAVIATGGIGRVDKVDYAEEWRAFCSFKDRR